MNVAILGASHKPSRFAYKAFHMLKEYKHSVYLVSPSLKELEGHPVVSRLTEIVAPIDTLTMYVGAAISTPLLNDILALKPRRVIFNPGSENPEIEKLLQAAGVQVQHACTLVLLRSDEF